MIKRSGTSKESNDKLVRGIKRKKVKPSLRPCSLYKMKAFLRILFMTASLYRKAKLTRFSS